MEFFQNNAIAGVPRPGPYYIYNYFPNAHPILLNKLLAAGLWLPRDV